MLTQELDNYINSLWKEYGEGYYIYLSTGEIHNKEQRDGEIRKLIENEQIDNFHDFNPLYIKYGLIDNRRIINKKSKKLRNETCIPWKNNDELFIKIYRKEGVQMIEDRILDAHEKAFIFTIIPYVEFKTNCIIVDGEYPTLEELAKMVGLSNRKINDVVKSLEKKNLIKRYKDGLYKKIFVNPEYMCAGSIIEGEVPSYFI